MTTPAIVSTVILAGTAVCAAWGMWRGAICQLGSVAAFLFGFLGARLFGTEVARLSGLPQVLCYIIVFALIFVVVMMLARVLKLTVRMLLLGAADRLCGALIGAAKWLLATSIALNLFILCDPHTTALSARPTQWTVELLPRLFGLAQDYLQIS